MPREVSPESGIVQLLRAEHQRILHAGRVLPELAEESGSSARGRALAQWSELSTLIELHADAEEEICLLPMYGHDAGGQAQIRDVLADLYDIRQAVWEAALQPPCSTGWWQAVTAALSACAEHCYRQEQGVISDFQRSASRPARTRIGAQWLAFTAARRRDWSIR